MLPSLSLEGVIGGVSTLLGGPQQQGENRGAAAAAAATTAAAAGGIQTPAPAISINRCCPICMVDLNNEDVVLIMPCDIR